MIAIGLMVGEYVVRHISQFSPMAVYENYKITTHSITVFATYCILENLTKQQAKKTLKA